jgi:biopolymer transport protein ExbB/TolQ
MKDPSVFDPPGATSSFVAETEPPLSWARHDIEQRLGFRGGRFTNVNNWLALLLATAASVLFYVAVMFGSQYSFSRYLTGITSSFTQRGPTPYVIVFFAWWALAILFLKWRKLTFQRRSLKYDVVPQDHDFVLSVRTADQVIERIHSVVDDPRHFVLFNQIMVALSNLKNLGRVTDIDEILRSQGSHDESAMETSFALTRGLIWAIPVLGFIGTVLGLSEAIGGFSSVLATTADVSLVLDALKVVTAGLATAFETTLQALVAALAIQMLLTFQKKAEEEFLDSCSDYCLRRIVSRLRVMPYEQE